MSRRGRYHYEDPDKEWEDTYRERNGNAVAWYVMGWHVEPDEDTEWTGIEVRTGRIVCRMVGDDADHLFDPEDMIRIDREDYCCECGQIGCTHDGLDRPETA